MCCDDSIELSDLMGSVNAGETETELKALRRSARNGTPFGTPVWQQRTAYASWSPPIQEHTELSSSLALFGVRRFIAALVFFDSEPIIRYPM